MPSRPLEGKAALITGASRGLGLAIAKAFMEAGAEVVLGSRTPPPAPFLPYWSKMDVTCDSDITQWMQEAMRRHGSQVSILVNNAAVYGQASTKLNALYWWETQRVNLFGSFMTARLFLEHAISPLKLIQITGGGGKPLPHHSDYAASKAGVQAFALSLAEELRGTGIDVNCLAPGPINTDMQQHAHPIPIERAAQLAVWLASSQSDGVTGTVQRAVDFVPGIFHDYHPRPA